MNKLKLIFCWSELLLLAPFFLSLATVFIINNSLVQGVVSGKYFWFYGCMGLVSIAAVIYSILNKQLFRFSAIDGLVFLFTCSVFLSALVFNDVSANSTKLTILALLFVLYLCLRLVLAGNNYEEIAGQGRNDKMIFFDSN